MAAARQALTLRSPEGVLGRIARVDKTFVKGLALLETLARSEAPRGVTELSRDLELTKSNVHRLLQTLQECGYIENDGSGKYFPTLKAWELGCDIWGRSALKRASSPFVDHLARRTGQLVHVVVAAGEDLICVEQVGPPSPNPFRRFTPVGARVRCWEFVPGGHDLIAIQVAYLAVLPPRELRRAIDLVVASSNRSITRRDLAARVQLAHERGYALNRGEWIDEIRGAAAAFLRADGQPAGVLGLIGHAATASDPMLLDRWGQLTMEAASGVSLALGWKPGRSAKDAKPVIPAAA